MSQRHHVLENGSGEQSNHLVHREADQKQSHHVYRWTKDTSLVVKEDTATNANFVRLFITVTNT
jgi:hypothetical protein